MNDPGKSTVCAAVISRNEAHLLADCLPRLRWATELLVLDMESSDATAEVARQHGAKVIDVPLVPIAERVRNVAVDATTCDWLLFVDPDELVPDSFPGAIEAHLRRTDVAAFRIPFREVAFGATLRHCFPGYRKLALVRPSAVRYDENSPAHREPTVAGDVVDLSGIEPFEHHSRRDVGSAAEKAFRYGVSGGVAAPDADPLDAFLLPRLLFRAVVRGGAWRDGRAGIAAVSLNAIGEYVGSLTQWEARGRPDPPLPLRTRMVLRTLSDLRRYTEALRQRIFALGRAGDARRGTHQEDGPTPGELGQVAP
jgi:hypothetical protein